MPWEGTTPIVPAKALLNWLLQHTVARFFINRTRAAIASARAGNVIGGGDWSEDRLVPDMVRGIASNLPIVIRRPESVRPWQHLLEPVRDICCSLRLYGNMDIPTRRLGTLDLLSRTPSR
jgi:CDP-glucose 4,6-dehydratase